MSKSEGRGIRKWLPNKYTIVKVFGALVVIKLGMTVVEKYVPTSIQPYLPNVS